MRRLWKLFRIFLWAAFAWFMLVVLWVVLPSPTSDKGDGSTYATSVLTSGRTLTRIYNAHSNFHTAANWRSAFVLDYTLDPQNLTLSMPGLDSPIPIIQPGDEEVELFGIQARIGDDDGVNLPWFEYADSILLYWWIHNDTIELNLSAFWSKEEGAHKLDLYIGNSDILLSLKTSGSRILANVPEKPLSSSPSWTYPLRVAIILVLAPTGIFLNENLGSLISFLFSAFLSVLTFSLAFTLYAFIIVAIVCSIWGCVGGPSLENTVQTVQDRLERLDQNERLRYLRLRTAQSGVDWAYHNKVVQGLILVCREGWHPDRERERVVEESELEKASPGK